VAVTCAPGWTQARAPQAKRPAPERPCQPGSVRRTARRPFAPPATQMPSGRATAVRNHRMSWWLVTARAAECCPYIAVMPPVPSSTNCRVSRRPAKRSSTGSQESGADLNRAIEAGCWFSVGVAMLASKTGRALASKIPRDRILTESDGPFAQYFGRPSVPRDVSVAVSGLADICPRLPRSTRQSPGEAVRGLEAWLYQVRGGHRTA
jgi:hypothetical protein